MLKLKNKIKVTTFLILWICQLAYGQDRAFTGTSELLYGNGYRQTLGLTFNKARVSHSIQVGLDKYFNFNDNMNPSLGYDFGYELFENFNLHAQINLRFGTLTSSLKRFQARSVECSSPLVLEERFVIGYAFTIGKRIKIEPTMNVSFTHGLLYGMGNYLGQNFECDEIITQSLFAFPVIRYSYLLN